MQLVIQSIYKFACSIINRQNNYMFHKGIKKHQPVVTNINYAIKHSQGSIKVSAHSRVMDTMNLKGYLGIYKHLKYN